MNKMIKMKTSTSMVIAAGLGGLAALAMAVQVRAGGDKVAFPEGFEKGELYATVDRYDNKQYRELFATPAAVAAARKGEPIPSETVLTLVQYKAVLDTQGKPAKGPNGGFVKGDLIAYTVMEKRAGWGTEYPPDIRNGEWEYQAFNTDKTVNEKVNLKGCFQCHIPFAAQDFVISLASLKGTKPGEVAAPKSGPGIVSIADFLFGPEKVSVAAGSAITWVNTDASPHQVTIKGKPQRTAVLLKGQSGSLSVAEAGTYEYFCGLHPAMKGAIEAK